MERQPNGNWAAGWPDLLAVLERAEIGETRLLPNGSNYVFVVALEDEAAGPGAAIYKPRRGESPLWDYPHGTLYKRERAAFLLSEALGWGIVPPTVVREGPHGVGMVQLYIDHSPRQNYFTVRDERTADLRRMALFDVLANNGDRKGGHCLIGHDARLWGIDHGLTFHHQGKLRTVIWDFVGQPAPAELLADVGCLMTKIERDDAELGPLREMLSKGEYRALRGRVEAVVEAGRYPDPPSWRPVPWPAV